MFEIDSENLWDFTTPFVPTFVPYNEVAKRLTDRYHDLLELPRTPAKAPKYNAVVASALASFQSVLSYQSGYLYWPIKQDRFTAYELAGRSILENVQKELQKHSLITLVHKGKSVFTKHKNDPTPEGESDISFQRKKLPTLWEVSEDLLQLDDFWDAEFQDGWQTFSSRRRSFRLGEISIMLNLMEGASAKIPTTEIEDKFCYDG
jgi:hypothetical protein